ncbi:MAG: radical SAM protein [Desulfurococcaceae archaeon]
MKIVLTAPATEMSEYDGNPAIAFASGFPKPFYIPITYLRKHFYKPTPVKEDYSLLYAPLGLRRIEASLVSSGLFSSRDVVIVHPNDLDKVVNEKTRVIGISVKDPMGLGYVSLTYSTLIGMGEPINKIEFLDLMNKVKKLRRKYRFRVVIGGPGVWQFRLINGILDKLGVDTVIEGEGELVAPIVFRKLALNEHVERFIKGLVVPAESIPCIINASIYGAVEITRGCGRGCMFCTPTMQLKRDFYLDKISRDIETNLSNGQNKILIVTEDLFLYGSRVPWEPNSDSILRLIDRITSYKKNGLKHVQITHMNLTSIKYRRDLFKQISDKLYEFAWYRLRGRLVNTVEVGIETGSPRLMDKYMKGKVIPYKSFEWIDIVIDSLTYMEEFDWIALGTIIVGLPGEESDDAVKTLELVNSIEEQGLRTLLIPLLFVPLGGCALQDQPIKSFNDLCDIHLSIFYECWKHNVRVYGPDFFIHYSFLKKLLFRILAKLYLVTTSRKYRWREIIARELYSEIMRVMNNRGVGY